MLGPLLAFFNIWLAFCDHFGKTIILITTNRGYIIPPTNLLQMKENNEPEDLLRILGQEVEKLIKDSHLSTAWVRKESHFGNTTFNNLKKGNLRRLNFDKVVHLTRCLFKGNPVAFRGWFIVSFWYLMSGSKKPL